MFGETSVFRCGCVRERDCVCGSVRERNDGHGGDV